MTATPNQDAPTEPDSLTARFGAAVHPDRPIAHPRPDSASDATVAALGKLSEAFEVVEHARGLLYGFHRLCGTADLTLQDAVRMLREAGHDGLADDLATALVGRDIVPGWWSFQLVEAYDDQYWRVFREAEQLARDRLGGAEPHVHEAEMKTAEQADHAG